MTILSKKPSLHLEGRTYGSLADTLRLALDEDNLPENHRRAIRKDLVKSALSVIATGILVYAVYHTFGVMAGAISTAAYLAIASILAIDAAKNIEIARLIKASEAKSMDKLDAEWESRRIKKYARQISRGVQENQEEIGL